MSQEKNLPESSPNSPHFKDAAAVKLVKFFGSWLSVILHTLIFSFCFIFEWHLDILLIIISIEAIYIGIFILMAENIEAKQKEYLQEMKRRQDMAVVEKDADIDEKTFQETRALKQKIDQLIKVIERK